MGAFQNIGLKAYFKRYGIRYGLLRGMFMAIPVHAVVDYENKKILYYRKIYRWVMRKCLPLADREPAELTYCKSGLEEPVWMYWKQGLENAPEIVKKCVESVRRYSGRPVILLTEKNIGEYIRLPGFAEEKLRDGKLPAAIYSDLLRLSLLEHYGGTWIDATVYLTGPLPSYITDSNLFAYQDSFGLIENPACFANWLLHCKPGNEIIRKTRNILFAYWEREDFAPEYLLSYLIFTAVVEKAAPEEAAIPYVSSVYTGLLLKELDQPYQEENYRHMIALSPVHKLTYKLKEHVTRQKGTYYEYIMQERL